MKTVFVIGGMGSGKSTVARLFEACGAVRLDLDEVGHEILKLPEVSRALVALFGDEVQNAAGGIDRSALAARTFADEQATAALNGVTEAHISTFLRAWLKQQEEQACAVAAVEVSAYRGRPQNSTNADLSASNLADYIVAVEAPEDLRVRRATDKGFDRGDVLRRMARQPGDAERRGWADFVIENTASPEDLRVCVQNIWKKITRPPAS